MRSRRGGRLYGWWGQAAASAEAAQGGCEAEGPAHQGVGRPSVQQVPRKGQPPVVWFGGPGEGFGAVA
eukprot:10871431-Lingulodinium_polyedra.AAC.1